MKTNTTLGVAAKGIACTEGTVPRFNRAGENIFGAEYAGHSTQTVMDAGGPDIMMSRASVKEQHAKEREYWSNVDGGLVVYDLIFSSVLNDSLNAGYLLHMFQAGNGFTRGLIVTSHAANPEPAVPHPEEPTMGPMLEQKCKWYMQRATELTRNGLQRSGKLRTWDEHASSAVKNATTKSAGGQSVQVDVSRPDSEPRMSTLKSKVAVLMAIGEEVFANHNVSAKYTADSPGKTGGRAVVGPKPDRAIYNVYIAHSQLQDLLASILHGIQSRDARFLISDNVGSPNIDHFMEMLGTTLRRIVFEARDATKFDTGQGQFLFKYMLKGFLDGLGEYRDAPFGPEGSGMETYGKAFELMFSEGIMWNTWFESGFGKWPSGYDKDSKVDQQEVAKRFGYFLTMLDMLLSDSSTRSTSTTS
jgi:hypothetical protein